MTPESVIFTYVEKHYICPIHGDIGNDAITSTLPGFEMMLCVRCYLEALQRIGVQQVKEKTE